MCSRFRKRYLEVAKSISCEKFVIIFFFLAENVWCAHLNCVNKSRQAIKDC